MNSLNYSSNFLEAKDRTKGSTWIDKRAAAKLLGLSVHTLKTYRQKHWQCGIHFLYLNSRAIRYHRELLIDWQANRFYPAAHQRAIEFYLASLLSNQMKKRGRKSK
jgi:hypothetical protein